jgi:hypothetical protein
MLASVFIGTSVDGFIARLNGDLDFLPPDGGEPHGYNEFFASVDAVRCLLTDRLVRFLF